MRRYNVGEQLRNFMFLVLFIMPLVLSAEESALWMAEASYTDNGSFGKFWQLTIDKSGKLDSKSGVYLVYPPKEDVFTKNIGVRSANSICERAKELGFFSISSDVGAKVIPIDGPMFYINIKCDSLKNKVRLYPGFTKSELNGKEYSEAEVFGKVWELLWESSTTFVVRSPFE